MKIAMAQMEVIPGNPRANREKMFSFIKEAEANNVDILIFPELAISGYMIGDLWEQPSFIKECLSIGREICVASSDMIIIYGNVGVDEKKVNHDGRVRLYNAFYATQQGQFITPSNLVRNFYIKTLSPNYRFFNEDRHLTPLTTLAVEEGNPIESYLLPLELDVKGTTITVGPLICEDSWSFNNPVRPANILQRNAPIDLFINISGSPFSKNKNGKRQEMFIEQAATLTSPIVYVNCVGMQNNGKSICTFDGESTAYNVSGSFLVGPQAFEEAMLFFDFDKETKTISPSEKGYILWSTKEEFPTRMETEIVNAPSAEQAFLGITYGIKKVVETDQIKDVVIGVSGGIDSAVNAALYAYVLGPEHVYLITMPSEFNSNETQSLAEALAHNLGCPFTSHSIDSAYKETVKELDNISFTRKDGSANKVNLSPLNEENVQARVRSSTILAGVASALGAVFTCNGNKTEISIGYATMYGDLAGFLAATGDLWKFEMYELAQYLNEKVYKREVIPEGTLHVVPSAELSANQDITKGQGDPLIYPYHDKLFRSFIEPWSRYTPEDILRAYKETRLESLLDLTAPLNTYFKDTKSFIEDLEKWWKLHSGFATVKRIQAPPIITISRRSYGNDLCEAHMAPYFTDTYYRLKEELLHNTK